MTPTRLLLPVVSLVAFLASACGISPEEFCKQYLDASSTKVAECYGSTAAAYRRFYEQFDICGDFTRAAAKKTLDYDGSKAQACLDETKKLTCDSVVIGFINAKSCTDAFAGVGAVGGACHSSVECGANLFCDSLTATGGTCPGQCKAYKLAGEDCGATAGAGCGSTLTCDSTTKKCIAVPSVGESCAASHSCKGAAYCAQDQTCTAYKTTGSCEAGEWCAPKYACTGATGAKTCTLRKKAGEACTEAQYECEVGVTCSATKCVAAAALGAACAGSSATTEGILCSDGYCDKDSKVCMAYKAAGAACTAYSAECGSFTHYCPADGKCPATPYCHVPASGG